MKRILDLTILCLLLSGSIGAQVTIGSGQKPNAGALLDLKTETDGTSKQGMVLPRVKLADIDALTMGTNVIANANNAWTNHAGLVVYNISGNPIPKCGPIPDGLYVWDGAKWNRIGTPEPVVPATLNLSGASSYYLPSGRDALPITAESFTVDWTPSDKPVAYTNVAHATFGGITFRNITASPLAASPASFSMTPDAMTPAEITANPFRTKESTLTFNATNECGTITTKSIAVNQTNKVLTVSTPFKEYIASAPNTTNTLTTNADWKLASIMPADATNAITNVRVGSPTAALATGVTQTDYEQNNNAGKAATLTYDIAVETTKARYSTLTFEDAAATKRFSDVTVTVLQCTNVGVSPSIEQWAAIAGFTQTEINDVKTTGADSPVLATGIQLHRDQSNNLFLSSSFHATDIAGDSERWMIHNLSATKFDTGQDYTGGATLIGKGLRPYNADGVPPGTNLVTIIANAVKNPYYAYPNGGTNNGSMTTTSYDNNPRLGLLYTWDAATAGKGDADGEVNVDNTGVLQESGFREGILATEQKRRQGICPSGWHLPSDDEWSVLEQNIVNNKSSFSSLATSTEASLNAELNNTTAPLGVNRPAPATTPATTPNVVWRGLLKDPNGHGNAMKEVCEPGTGNFKGASNGINSTDRPGFDALLAGYVLHDKSSVFGSFGYFWSASSSNVRYAWVRYFNYSSSQVSRYLILRNYLISVRCKK